LTVSAALKKGIDTFWTEIERFRTAMTESGRLQAKRQQQAVDWMWTLIDTGLRNRFRHHPQVQRDLAAISDAVAAGRVTPAAAACRLLTYLDSTPHCGEKEPRKK
jgi:LAO/AO transport system kinase